ncbi:MAG: ABC transporter permease subunit [Lentisphaeria bacterium]|jgi:NitT/TauT family transport system permease protein
MILPLIAGLVVCLVITVIMALLNAAIPRLFEIRGSLSERMSITLQVVGILLIVVIWWGICATGLTTPQILPSPITVLKVFPELHYQDALILNLLYSLLLNSLGYLEAIAVCLPIGFVIGMIPLFREMFNKIIDSTRFVPLTAVTCLFIAWCGIENNMKVQFLAFGIIVYLLPVVIQRVSEVPEVYQQTAFTLGASKWQMFKTAFFPYVLGRVVQDIRVLVAISWTYIIIAEMLNNTGGIGGIIYVAGIRQGRTDKIFALLFVIVVIGFCQDKIFQWLDKVVNPSKYA